VVRTSRSAWRFMGELDGRAGQVPRYSVIAAALRSDIEQGRLPAGVQFPSERKLMRRFGVARSTVRAAIAQLRSEGMVAVEKGAGSFVRDPGRDRCQIDARVVGMWLGETAGERPFKLARPEPHVAREPAGEKLAKRMEVAADTRVLKQEVVGPGPEIERQWTRAALHPGTEHDSKIRERDLAHDELASVLSSRGISMESVEDEVEARMPSPEEREKLGILDGVPVLDVVRMIRAEGRAAAVIETVVAADLVSLRYSLPPS
jgi:GntR family transcriptional regulator